jgi:HrpA-like RNA helicase
MGISNISTFDFLSKPDDKSISAALRELTYLRAIQSSNDNTFELTDDGRKMACFPLDPKFVQTKFEYLYPLFLDFHVVY